MTALPLEEWTPSTVAVLEEWRMDLAASLQAELPLGTTVEFLTYRELENNQIRRFVNIYVGSIPTKVAINFPEPIEDIVARVLEAIK